MTKKIIPVQLAVKCLVSDVWSNLIKFGKVPKELEKVSIKDALEFLGKNNELYYLFMELKTKHLKSVFEYLYDLAKSGKVDIKNALESAINRHRILCQKEVSTYPDAMMCEFIMKQNRISITEGGN